MTSAAMWVAGARPRTLPAAVSPVVVGTGLAIAAGAFVAPRALLALIVAVALQVGVNYANDYSDGIRGTDEKRVGPVRLVGQGLASPAAVRAAALASLVVSAVAGLVLVALTAQWWLLTVGGCALLAAWLYTGGPKPYGYLGLGEVFVFVFFGIVPVVGTAYVQTLTFSTAAWVSSIGVGALICAILVANNLRDTPTDSSVGKRTLAVRMGDGPTRVLYVALVMSAFVVIVPLAALLGLGFAWLGFLAAPLAIRPMAAVLGGASGGALVAVLKTTGVVVLAYGLLLGLGIGLS